MTKEEDEKRLTYLKSIVLNLPETPGCYQYLDETGKIIYVGKAKNLKRRVSSYFNKNQQTRKTRLLVDKIIDIKYVVVKTEEDALLLENNLIKKYQPHYNILLKDGKTYPSICISNDYFPRVFKTRKIVKDGSKYYGPYSSVPMLYALLDLFKKIYKIRTCHLPLTPENIKEDKFKVCLEYHIKNCKGPCQGLQSHEDYMKDIEEIRQILNGNTREVLDHLMEEMKGLASDLRFEEAQVVKNKYDLIENYRAKSQVVSHILNNIDVYSMDEDGQSAFINYLHITNGCINQAFTFEYKKKLDETREELLAMGITEMRERYKSFSREIVVPFDPGIEINNVSFTIPKGGERKKLLDLSLMNVKEYKLDKLKRDEKLNPEQKSVRLMNEIQKDLKLPSLPIQIECFDNSNIQGSDAVAGCVVFKMGKPSKKDYRKYIIKTVIGPDDYASMQEVVRRRYSRMIEEKNKLPDLIITDGGKGQMSAVREVVEGELGLHIPIAGLAKNDKHRTNELLYGNPPVVIGMKTDSALFHLLTHIQDEVHRFAITFHRDKRSKRQIASALDKIKGIGDVTKTTLLRRFKSVKRIREASVEELTEAIGAAKAKVLLEGLKGL